MIEMTLEDKVLITKMRIQQWYDHWNGEVYLAFSGGRDSTVLAHIINEMGLDIPFVFNNTGLEYPEIKQFVKSFGDKVTWLKPTMSYQKVVEKYGFALVSKETSQKIYEVKNTKSEKLKDIRINGYPNGSGKIANKWLFLKDAPFDVSSKCCDKLKKDPAKRYEKLTGKKVITGEMDNESALRRVSSERQGNKCNAYDNARPKSKPISKWSKQDILDYIEQNNVEISEIYEMGYDQTGCAWCAFGMFHPSALKKGDSKFKLMKKTHPKIYNYSLDKMGLREPIEYICSELNIDVDSVI